MYNLNYINYINTIGMCILGEKEQSKAWRSRNDCRNRRSKNWPKEEL